MYIQHDATGRYLKKKKLEMHRPHRIVHLVESPPDIAKEFAEAADKTRWWILDQGYWQDPQRTLTTSDDMSVKGSTSVLFPLSNDSDRPATCKTARYFIGFDAVVRKRTKRGFKCIDPDNTLMSDDELNDVIDHIALTRGE